jgi:hypothetical protein
MKTLGVKPRDARNSGFSIDWHVESQFLEGLIVLTKQDDDLSAVRRCKLERTINLHELDCLDV